MRTRRRFSGEFKAKVAVEAIQGHRTVPLTAIKTEMVLAQLAKHFDVPNQITTWKAQCQKSGGRCVRSRRWQRSGATG